SDSTACQPPATTGWRTAFWEIFSPASRVVQHLDRGTDAGAQGRSFLESRVGSVSGPGLIVFFFQAEDGIRDYKVTGVQTCLFRSSSRPAGRHSFGDLRGGGACLGRPARSNHEPPSPAAIPLVGRVSRQRASSLRHRQRLRSEERRVGKERRSQWDESRREKQNL